MANVDSLQAVIATTQNKAEKIDLLNNLIDTLSKTDYEAARLYSDSVIANIAHLKEATILTNTGETLHKIALVSVSKGRLLDAEKRDSIALDIFQRLERKDKIAAIAQSLARINGMQRDLDTGLEYAALAKPLFKELKDTLNYANTLYLVSNFHLFMGNSNKGIESCLAAINFFDRLGNTSKISQAYNVMANLMMNIRDYEKADFYLEQYYKTAKKLKDKNSQGHYFINKANLEHKYFIEDSLKTHLNNALAYQKKALVLYQATKNPTKISTTLGNIGTILWKLERPEEALTYLHQVVEVNQNTGKSLMSTYTSLGKLYFQQAEYQKAINYLNQAIDLQIEKHFFTGISANYKTLSEAYFQIKDFKKAYSALDKSYSTLEEVVAEKKIEQTRELEAKYQKSEDEKKIIQQDLEIEKQKLDVQKRNYGLLSFGLLVVLLSRMGYSNYQKNQANLRHNQVLLAKNENISFLHKELKHRVKNNLQLLSSLMSMQVRRLDNEGAKAALRESENRIQSITSLYQKLDNNEEESVDVQEYLNELCNHLKYAIGRKIENLELLITVPKNLHIDTDQISKIGLITNELVTNSIKHAFQNHPTPTINISLSPTMQNKLHLHISDNGAGRTFKTQIEHNTSLGLKLVNNLVQQLQGTIEIKNQPGVAYNIFFTPSKIAA